jgi:hypothetical protein
MLDRCFIEVQPRPCKILLAPAQVAGGPGVKPGFAASDAAVLFGYTTHPFGIPAGKPTRISSLGPKRHHALDHASLKCGGDAEN